MFTTGSKLFLGATALAIVAAIVMGVTLDGPVGQMATISLIGAAVALAFLAGVNFFIRDGNVPSMEPDAVTTAPAAQEPPTRTFWPMVAALGAALVVIGLVTRPVVFQAGVVVLLAVLLEWMILSWSERASADRTFNASLRKRLLHPLEFPVLAAAGVAIIVYSFSRIMLFISKSTGPAVFGVLAALLLVAGVLIAYSPGLKRSIVIGVSAIAALGLVSTGAVMAIEGEREMHTYPIVAADPTVCASNEETEVDENASQTVGAKHSVHATITQRDGRLIAEQGGQPGTVDTITLQRANPSVVLFRNEDEEPARLTAHLGAFETEVNGTTTIERPVTCTALVEDGGTQAMVLRISRSSAASDEPYRLAVPGNDESSITIEVP